MNKGEKYHRHWYIVRKKGDRRIRCLLSAFSVEHLKKKCGLMHNKDCVIQEAKRWHITMVFSGSPVFRDYKTRYGTEDINELVSNEFYTVKDGEDKILVKVLG